MVNEAHASTSQDFEPPIRRREAVGRLFTAAVCLATCPQELAKVFAQDHHAKIPSPERVHALITQLDDRVYAVRLAARCELEKYTDLRTLQIISKARKHASPEVRKCAEALFSQGCAHLATSFFAKPNHYTAFPCIDSLPENICFSKEFGQLQGASRIDIVNCYVREARIAEKPLLNSPHFTGYRFASKLFGEDVISYLVRANLDKQDFAAFIAGKRKYLAKLFDEMGESEEERYHQEGLGTILIHHRTPQHPARRGK